VCQAGPLPLPHVSGPTTRRRLSKGRRLFLTSWLGPCHEEAATRELGCGVIRGAGGSRRHSGFLLRDSLAIARRGIHARHGSHRMRCVGLAAPTLMALLARILRGRGRAECRKIRTDENAARRRPSHLSCLNRRQRVSLHQESPTPIRPKPNKANLAGSGTAQGTGARFALVQVGFPITPVPLYTKLVGVAYSKSTFVCTSDKAH
jgi:hypothetical protein